MITGFRFYGTPHLIADYFDLMIFKTKLMRLISTFCLLLFSSVCFSQIYDLIRKADIDKEYFASKSTKLELCNMKGVFIKPFDLYAFQQKVHKIDTTQTKISLRCGISSKRVEPLWIVDGFPVLSIDNINTNDIESVSVLKEAEASAIFGCRAAVGVIIITTKSGKVRKFTIQDFLDGNPVSNATVCFVSTDKKDTVITIANDSGVVMTDKLKSSKLYEMSVTAIGYTSLHQSLKNSYCEKDQRILLEMDVKFCDEVVIHPGNIIRCSRIYKRISCGANGVKTITIINDSLNKKSDNGLKKIKTYPNPVQKGSLITVETTTDFGGIIELKLISLDGKILLSQPQNTIKGLNRFTLRTDNRWPAGIYFLQLYANGKLMASNKIVIQ